MPKPTIINARKSVIGNLVFLSGELDISTGAVGLVVGDRGGFDFSDHVSRILDFDFIAGSSSPTVIEQIQVHAPLKNEGNQQILNFPCVSSIVSQSNGSQRGLIGGQQTYVDGTERKIAIVNGGSGYSNGTHTGQVLTGQDSGANNGRATVIVSGGTVTSVDVTTHGTGYHFLEKITVAAPGGGSGAEILAYGDDTSNNNAAFAAQFFPLLLNNTKIKIINFYSDSGNGGLLNDSNENVKRTCEFTLIGKR
tara:strand:- start:5032 stop:5784 length:753 start_codon:yes stop_codon:yes gene_type:complete